jgi:hypothetical protein
VATLHNLWRRAVSNIQDIRAQLRAEASAKPGASAKGLPIVAALGGCAIVASIIYVLFLMPVRAPLQPSGSLQPLKPSALVPSFQRVGADGLTERERYVPPPSERASPPAKYAGMSPRQAGKVADEVCFARAHTRFPHWSKTPRLTTKALNEFSADEMQHFDELLQCLLMEGLTRYCSSSQRSMIAAEVAWYFRALDYGNKVLARVRAETASYRARQENPYQEDPAEAARIRRIEFAADPRVVTAIEARLADGVLTKADRDTFSNAAAPQWVRLRLAGVKPSTPRCPAPPWWAFWRGL